MLQDPSPNAASQRAGSARLTEAASEPIELVGRRQWISQVTALGAVAFLQSLAHGQDPAPAADEQAVLDRVNQRAKAAGLGELRTQEGDQYLAIGNAADRFQKTAIGLCDALAADFLQHFEDRKFPIHKPQRKMVLVVLANPEDFAAFVDLKEGAGPVRGIYEVAAGWLVVCNNREKAAPKGERANSVALFHEATHQLTYETGLLSPPARLPLAIVEGLGTYGEVRRPDGRTRIGAVNTERLAVLSAASRDGASLFALGDLLADDELLELPRTEQLAYAQSWALIHLLMQPAWAPKFGSYLELANTRRDPKSRLDDATKKLGSLAGLDNELKKHVNKLMRR
jgi:hypothetical protein